MGKKHVDQIKPREDSLIGRGEKTLVKIFEEKIPGAKIFTQVPLKYFVPKEEVQEFSERQQKETIDVLVIHRNRWTAFRVQHGSTKKYHPKGHLGDVLAQADLVQKRLIQKYHGPRSVIDLRESECKQLFKEEKNWYSESEVGIQCMLEGFKL